MATAPTENDVFIRAKLDFADFIRYEDRPVGKPGASEGYLGFHLVNWLLDGEGVRMTGGSFETYLRIALHIADLVVQGEISLDYLDTQQEPAVHVKRPFLGLTGPHSEGVDPPQYANRELYEHAVFECQLRLHQPPRNEHVER
jgi:hypothetical protein